MSKYDYDASQRLESEHYPFYALIMTAMRQADSTNSAKLKMLFPDVWDELDARYHSPGGFLGHETQVHNQNTTSAYYGGRIGDVKL